jgi:hypothetical protein
MFLVSKGRQFFVEEALCVLNAMKKSPLFGGYLPKLIPCTLWCLKSLAERPFTSYAGHAKQQSLRERRFFRNIRKLPLSSMKAMLSDMLTSVRNSMLKAILH